MLRQIAPAPSRTTGRPARSSRVGDRRQAVLSSPRATGTRYAVCLDDLTLWRHPTMKALCWHGKKDIRYDTVPDPKIEEPRDAIIKMTSCAICGSDLHLFGGF